MHLVASFFTSHRDCCLYLSLLLLFVELFLQAFCAKVFWSPETIEVFGCGRESLSEGFTQVVSCCVRQYREHAQEFVKFVSHSRSGDVFFYSENLISSRRHISQLIVPDFGRPMQLLRGDVD